MLHFVGAGSGAKDLITLRGYRLLSQADVVIYAGSLVNPELLEDCKADAKIHNSALMSLDEIMDAIRQACEAGLSVVRLHSGDPSLYGAIAEQIRECEEAGIDYDITPGVSSFASAAAAVGAEYTPVGISQTLIISRVSGTTPTPDEEDIAKLAAHNTSMVLFLSVGLVDALQEKLLAAGRAPSTPCAVVSRVSWPDEAIYRCTLETLASTAREHGVTKSALFLVGDFLEGTGEKSRLYAPDFSTEYRAAKQ